MASLLLAAAGRRVLLLYWLFTLPGTFAHELAHWLVAALWSARPRFPSLLPHQRADGHWALGSVAFRPGFFSTGFIALAPAYLLPPLAGGLLLHLGQHPDVTWQAGGGYVFASILLSALPSRTDWALALRYPGGTLILMGMAVWLLMGMAP